MSPKIRKVIIPIAGYGTRFLPATKAMPKEMLPIIDKPVIQYAVEEAVKSGIEDVILVTSQSKHAVENYFDDNKELEAWLQSTGKEAQLKEIRDIGQLANFVYIRQKGPYGNATPVLNCRHLIGHDPFAVLFGDELFTGEKPRLRQMIDLFEKYGDPVLGVMEVDDYGTTRYGMVDPAAEVEPGVYQLKGLVEKPGPEKAPSHLASIGAYVLTPDIFDVIERTPPGHGGEHVLLDAILGLMSARPIYAIKLAGEYFDTGNKIGWLKANIYEALKREDMREQTQDMLERLRNQAD